MPEPQHDDIVVRLRLSGTDSVDAKVLLEALDAIESALYASDRQDVEMAARELEMSPVIRDASLERLRHYRHHRLLIQEAHTGSIELVAVIAGVSLYVIEKTFGEAFSDGFKESRVYGALRDFFRTQIDRKALFISESLRRAFAGRKRQVIVRADPARPDLPRIVQIEIAAEHRAIEGRPARSLGEEIRR